MIYTYCVYAREWPREKAKEREFDCNGSNGSNKNRRLC